ncbi:PaaI family thioesterase [Pacificimonas sp. ICDLI1SI03]
MKMTMAKSLTAEMTERQKGMLPGELFLEWKEVGEGRVSGCFTVARRHLAPNGYLHAASIIALTDSACGYGCLASLPDRASSFTTIELKANYLGTAKLGEIVTCEARLVHGGKSTQVWDAEAINEATSKKIALFRCTQMIIYPL